MKLQLLVATTLTFCATTAVAQDFTPTRSITAFTEIADDYYGDFTVVTDLQNEDSALAGSLDETLAAEVDLGGSVTYADAGQWSWVDSQSGDFEAEGFAAGGLYNQYFGEMRSESLMRADFVVATSGAAVFSYDLWFGESYDGLSSHDRLGQSVAEVRIEDSLGTVVFLASSSFEDGSLSGNANVPLGPGQYTFVARAEIQDASNLQTVVGSMTVANFYVEGSLLGSAPLPQAAMHVDWIEARVLGERRKQLGTARVRIVDAAGVPIAGALVTGSFSGSMVGTYSCLTDANGIARVNVANRFGRKKTLMFCVSDVTHSSREYDDSQNVQDCQSSR